MNILLYWGIFFGAMGIVLTIALYGQNNRPPTYYDGIHKIRDHRGK